MGSKVVRRLPVERIVQQPPGDGMKLLPVDVETFPWRFRRQDCCPSSLHLPLEFVQSRIGLRKIHFPLSAMTQKCGQRKIVLSRQASLEQIERCNRFGEPSFEQ